MRPIALGTKTHVGFKRGDQGCGEVMRRAERLLLGVTVIGKLLAGFACGEREARNREELQQFLDGRFLPMTSGSQPVAWSMGRPCSPSMPTSSRWMACG